jgi:hypothetical protein
MLPRVLFRRGTWLGEIQKEDQDRLPCAFAWSQELDILSEVGIMGRID